MGRKTYVLVEEAALDTTGEQTVIAEGAEVTQFECDGAVDIHRVASVMQDQTDKAADALAKGKAGDGEAGAEPGAEAGAGADPALDGGAIAKAVSAGVESGIEKGLAPVTESLEKLSGDVAGLKKQADATDEDVKKLGDLPQQRQAGTAERLTRDAGEDAEATAEIPPLAKLAAGKVLSKDIADIDAQAIGDAVDIAAEMAKADNPVDLNEQERVALATANLRLHPPIVDDATQTPQQ